MSFEIVSSIEETITDEERKRKDEIKKTLEQLHRIKENGQFIKVLINDEVIKEINDKTVHYLKFDANGVEGIIPFARSGFDFPNQMKQIIGQQHWVKVIEVKDNLNAIIADRKVVLNQKRDYIFKNFSKGKIIKGKVVAAGKSSVSVDIHGGFSVKIPREEVAICDKFTNLKDLYNIGESINVSIVSMNPEKKLIALSVLDTLNLSAGKSIVGKVVYIKEDLVYAEISKGVQALVIKKYNDQELSIGDTFQGKITSYDKSKGKLRVIFKDSLTNKDED